MGSVNQTKRHAARQTLRSIAEAAGVSRQTVSNAINRPERVAPETLERVRAAIVTMGYQPNELARALASRSSRLIGFHVGDGSRNEASVLDPFLRELARIGDRHGHRMVLSYSPETDEAHIEGYAGLLARSAVDGFVIANTHERDARPAWLSERGVPFVAFGRPWGVPEARHSWIDVDAASGVERLVGHLAKLGHRRIGFVSGPAEFGIAGDRLAGWRAGLARCGLDGAGLHAESPTWVPRVEGEVARVLAAGATALIGWDDLSAVATMHAVEAHGLRTGVDVSIASCDDSQLTRELLPRLTALAQPLTEIAGLVWDSLLAQLHGGEGEPLQRLVAPQLKLRDSTCPPRESSRPL